MASEEDHIAIYNEEEDEEEEDEPLKDVVLDDDGDVAVGDRFAGAGDSSDSDETNSTSSAAFSAVPLSSSSAVSIAVFAPSSSAPINGSDPPNVTTTIPSSSAIVAMPAPSALGTVGPLVERKPFDDSRKLFQKLWTDEDEIELLRGFLEYNTHRGPNWSGHHHDTTAFYDQIKSKIQLDCNKNQLVEKLRRLKKKYRTVVARISSGKEFVFKCPHDQTIFEISRKIWGNSTANRPEFEDDDQNPNPSGTPVAVTPQSAGDQRAPAGFSIDINSPDKMMMMMNTVTPNRSRKRSRMQPEEKSSINLNSFAFEPLNVAPSQGSVEETIRSCLTPMLKDFLGNFTSGSDFGSCGSNGIGSLVANASLMNFTGVNLGNRGNVMDERWRKQLILELEVYSKRLKLVQDQIKLSLEDLGSRGS